MITGLLHGAHCFEVLDVVVGGSLWDIEFVDNLGDCDGTVLQYVGVHPSEDWCFEEVDDRLKLLNRWLARPGWRMHHLDYELWIIRDKVSDAGTELATNSITATGDPFSAALPGEKWLPEAIAAFVLH